MTASATSIPAPSSTSSGRWLRYVAYAFIVLQCGSFWIWCSRIEDYAPDSSTYQGLADSIRLHGTYRFNFAPHIQYPPGLPLFLVAIGAFFGTAHLTYLHAIAVTSAMALYVGHAFVRSEQDDVAATVGTLLLGASTYYLIYSTAVLNSDVPYLLISIGALLAGRRLESSERGAERRGWSVLFGVLLVASVLLRSAGIALVGGYILWLALSSLERRGLDRRRLTTIGIPVALATATQVAWWSYVDRVRPEALEAWGAGAYTDALRLVDPHQPALGTATIFDLLARVPRNVVQHSAHFVELLGIDWVDQRWYSPLVVLPLLLIAAGFAATLRRRRGPMECYFVAYAVIYALWPYDVGARFVLPVFPIAFVYAWRGVATLLRRSTAASLRTTAIVAAGAALLGVASWAAQTTAAPASAHARAACVVGGRAARGPGRVGRGRRAPAARNGVPSGGRRRTTAGDRPLDRRPPRRAAGREGRRGPDPLGHRERALHAGPSGPPSVGRGRPLDRGE